MPTILTISQPDWLAEHVAVRTSTRVPPLYHAVHACLLHSIPFDQPSKTPLHLSLDHPIHPPETEGDPFHVKYWPCAIPALLSFVQGIAHLELAEHHHGNGPTGDGTLLPNFPPISLQEFIQDDRLMRTFVGSGPLKSFCYRRLSYLSSKFSLHVLLNESRESLEQKQVPHRDFYNIRKVDTHVHAASCMNQKHLLRFIKKCFRTRSNELVCQDKKTDEPMTLKQLMDHLKLTVYDLNIDNLDVHATNNPVKEVGGNLKSINPPV
ncbi:unnamed protein product [Dibothriocephalus latus]|uniref:Uncharacterized protein n=1 Tax=Dibothriocephalus latus TaxID=60516 RepID=A0A3P6QC18_DIBLA|nr:unnamed protein product [Dibothriocephalus latus]